jgi:hypothetical protein
LGEAALGDGHGEVEEAGEDGTAMVIPLLPEPLRQKAGWRRVTFGDRWRRMRGKLLRTSGRQNGGNRNG